MRLSILSLLVASTVARAGIIPELLEKLENLQNVEKRCANPCGYYGQLCCAAGQVCYTDNNNQAQCGNAATAVTTNGPVVTAAASGTYQLITSTFVQTDLKTVTSTYTVFVPTSTQASCSFAQGEQPCGNVCCLSDQYCAAPGSCISNGGGSSIYYSGLLTVTTILTNTASAPLRPTSNGATTVTGSTTTTQPFITPVATGGSVISGPQASSNGSLSGGAIAGIVIGVIAGILILLLICACCCFKGLLDGLLAIFGLGNRRRRTTEETYVEERHSRRGGRTWFGFRPGRRTEVVDEKKKKSGGFGPVATAAAFLGGLALILGLRRKSRKDNRSDTGYGSSYYYSDYTVSSKLKDLSAIRKF